MPKMPTLGPQPRKSSGGKLLMPLLVAAMGIGGYRYYKRHQAELTQTPADAAKAPLSAAATQPVPPGPDAGAATPGAAAAGGLAQAQGTPPGAAAIVASATDDKGPKSVSFSLDGALETSLAAKVGESVAAPLAQVLTRTLVWWVQVPNELLRGDRVDLVYEIDSDGEPQVDALRLVSHKFDKTFSAFRFKAEGDTFSRLYEPDGLLLEKHLVSPPLDSYEQVTSLLRDGRHHKGVDFKTPVGSKVHSPFAGTITRKNWNWRGNGNCLEVTEAASPHRHVYFLHLSPLPASVKVGQRVAKGQVLAESGNTGHSFAPHLHYQLMAANNTKVLDPFDEMKTVRIPIAAAQKPALEKEIARLSALMGASVVSAAAK